MRITVILLGQGPAPTMPPDVEVLRAKSRIDGWRVATGQRVAFFDTRYQAGDGWSKGLSSIGTVGGVVQPLGSLTWAGWVYYIVEYGWQKKLVAGNICYDKPADLDELDPGSGVILEEMTVSLCHAPGFSDYIAERFEYSFRWGRERVNGFAALLRLALPLLVLLRVPWWRRPSTLPGVLVISLVMAAGELVGGFFPRDATLKG